MGSMMHYEITLVNGSTINFTGPDEFSYSARNDEHCWHFTQYGGGRVIVKRSEFSHLISGPATQTDGQASLTE